jgi:16S rRNA G966 N2-methylase RsmD
MTGSLRIQSGSHKGKRITPPVPSHGKSNATPSLVKEAIFQILRSRFGADLPSYAFFDLCAGSGQIGLEALSCGFGEIHIVEPDQDRFTSIMEVVRKNRFEVHLHKKQMLRMVSHIIERPKSVIFIDLPYSFWEGESCPAIRQFLEHFDRAIRSAGTHPVECEGLIIIQGASPYAEAQTPESPVFGDIEVKRYRKNYLTLIRFFAGRAHI